MTKPRSRDGFPIKVDEITALVDPRLAGALCTGKAPLFDAFVLGETPTQRDARLGAAVECCTRCPVRNPCRQAATEHDAHGIWAGQHHGPPERHVGRPKKVAA